MQDINTIIENLGFRFIAVPMKADFKAALKQEYGVSATYALLNADTIKEAIENEYEECEGRTLIDSDNDKWKDFLSVIGEVVVPFNDSHLFHMNDTRAARDHERECWNSDVCYALCSVLRLVGAW